MTFIDTSTLSIIPIKSSAATPTIDNPINLWSTVTAAGVKTAAEVKTAHDTGKISIGNAYWAVRVDNLIFTKDAGADTFTKNVAAAAFTTPVYDSTLNFAYAGGKLYKYGTTYEEIAAVSGLKTTIKLYANADKSKVCIFTYEVGAGGGSTYDAVMKIYSQPASGSTWTAVTLPIEASTFSTVSGEPTFVFSSTFETVGVFYTGGAVGAL